MDWLSAKQLMIFVPPILPYEGNWVEQVLGTIIQPVVVEFEGHIQWLWITRYGDNTPVDGLPERFLYEGNWRHVLFRLSTRKDLWANIEAQSLALVEAAGCYALNGWQSYNVVDDLGSDRFVSPASSNEIRSKRAHLVVNFMDATARLMLDALVRDNLGRWSFEINTDTQNPNQSFFESVHHLFCNATSVPTTILLETQADRVKIGTFWMRQPIDIKLEPERDLRGQVHIHY